MTVLSDFAEGRDNNLNLIRAVAATAVLISHAYPISLGPGTPEPLSRTTGFSLGMVAVSAFFVISGFLIAQSYERSTTHTGFLVARFLRLWPGLIVCTVLVALGLGPLVTSLPASDYLTHPDTWEFIIRDITLVSVTYHLPGVFEDQPYTAVVGSIWTLFYEVVCYVGLFLLGVVGVLQRKAIMAVIMTAGLVLFIAVDLSDLELHYMIVYTLKLALPFGVGACFYVWRHWLPLSPWIAAGLATVALTTKGTVLYVPLFTVALGYTVFWLAYVPGGWVRAYNRLGDYSYGIYIYAFPIQGFAVWAFGSMSPWTNMAIALPLTLVLSLLSWHFVEKPSLAQRGQLTNWLLGHLRQAEPAAR